MTVLTNRHAPPLRCDGRCRDDECPVLDRRGLATIEYKRRVNAAWLAANPKRRAPQMPFPEVAS